MKLLRFVLSFSVLLTIFPMALTAQTVWKKLSGPVMPVWEGNINDPSGFRYTYNPSVIYDSAAQLYKVWYCYLVRGAGRWSLGYAISHDGLTWYNYSKNPVLEPGEAGTFDSQAIFDPFVIKVGNELRLYYDGYNGMYWQTGVATSVNGISWKKFSGNPVLAVRAGTWESIGCNAPKVFWSGEQFVMFYTGHSSLSLAEIGTATSPDGFAWTRNPLNPVLRRGPSGSWDQGSIRGTAGFTAHGRFYLLYDGGASTPIGFASSEDGVVWTKYSQNPVFFPGVPGVWDNERVEIGSVLCQGPDLKFWYSGYGYNSKLGTSVWQIGYASSDLLSPAELEQLGSDKSPEGPHEYRLSDAQPNPFNPETEIRYSIPVMEHVHLTIFDALGKQVATLVDEVKQSGSHVARWMPSSTATGVYFYRISAGSYSETKKLVLLK